MSPLDIPNAGCAVFVFVRKLYWTDQGTESGIPGKVASADMDGGNPTVLFTGNLDHVEFLALDLRENKLYWAVTGTGMVGTGPPNLLAPGFSHWLFVTLFRHK